ncbi:MAG: DUF4259 domain-containing protein [Thermodesulfobacteriota bacterium]
MAFKEDNIMGTWGITTFENDDALDWLHDLAQSSDIRLLKEALEVDEEIESWDASVALAASEVIAGLSGSSRGELPENAQKWINDNKNLDIGNLPAKASNVIDLILNDDSELFRLWKESEDFEAWKNNVLALQHVLRNIS